LKEVQNAQNEGLFQGVTAMQVAGGDESINSISSEQYSDIKKRKPEEDEQQMEGSSTAKRNKGWLNK